MMQAVQEKSSVGILRECIELQLKKGKDYQNPNSNVRQAMHYRRGIDSLHDLVQGKVYRAQSLIETLNDPEAKPNFESLEDTYKDIINYCSFAVEWLRGEMDGQDCSRDIFNRKIPDGGVQIPKYLTGEKSTATPSSATSAQPPLVFTTQSPDPTFNPYG